MRPIKALAVMLFVVLCVNISKPSDALANQDNDNSPESVIIFWTDGTRLKAVNLTFSLNRDGPIGIISVPVYTWLDTEQSVTVAEYYLERGPEKLIRRMETLFGSSITAYIIVDQRALVNVSNVIGPIYMADRHTTLMDEYNRKT